MCLVSKSKINDFTLEDRTKMPLTFEYKLVPAIIQFLPQTPELFLSQHPLNSPEIEAIWLTQLQSKFVITNPLLINFDLEFSHKRCRNPDLSASFYL